MASHAPQLCPFVWGERFEACFEARLKWPHTRLNCGLLLRPLNRFKIKATENARGERGPKPHCIPTCFAETGYRERRRSENPSGQIVPTIGNSLIQTVANSSTIWRGAVVGTFPISFGPQHIPRGTPSEFHPTPPRSLKSGPG